MNYDKIGSFIQQKRKDKGLTQKQLAEKLGVTDRAISKWERGQGCPDVSILEIRLLFTYLCMVVTPLSLFTEVPLIDPYPTDTIEPTTKFVA